MRRYFFLAITLSVLGVALATWLRGQAGPGRTWRTVQLAEQGFALRVPSVAAVRYFEAGEILQVELAAGQVLSVGTFENPTRLTAREWAEVHLLDGEKRGLDPLVPVVPVIERQRGRVAGLPAETMVVVSPVNLYRRTVVVQEQRAYLIGYPVGDESSEVIFEQIAATFEPGTYREAVGFELVPDVSGEEIPNLQVPYYNQRDPSWTCDQIGTCYCYMGACIGFTGIGDAGCYITAEAMIFEYYTGGYLNPQELDTCLTQNGGYTYWRGCGYGLCAVSYNPLPACKPEVVSYQSYSSNLSLLDEDLRNGFPVVAWVDYGSHYLVIIGKRDGLYQVHDPLYPRTQIYPGQIIHFVRYHGPLPQDQVRVELQPGFPVQAYHTAGPVPDGQILHTVVANLDMDPALEVAATALSSGPLYAWNADSSLMSAWPPAGEFGSANPAAGNLSSGARGLEMVAGYSGGMLVTYTAGGLAGSGWPVEVGPGVGLPVLGDADGDGYEEIFLSLADGWLHGYRHDGSSLPGWPVQTPSGLETGPPAIADLDGDGDLEIIAATEPTGGQADLLAYHHTGALVSGYPVAYPGLGSAFPVVGDVDGDGLPEVVVVASGGTVLVFGAGGALERTLQAVSPISAGSAPALADMDGDSRPEILVQAERSLDVWQGDGTPQPGWPESWGSGFQRGASSPVVGDVDGDGLPDVVVTLRATGSETEGQLRVYDHAGHSLPDFPKVLEIGAGAVPSLADIDLDGRNEVIIASALPQSAPGFSDKIWAFDLGGEAHGQIEWGQLGGGPEHRGVYPVPPPPAPPPAPLPQGIQAFLPVLSKPVPPRPPGISGRVTRAGEGAAGVTLILRAFDGAAWSDLSVTLTAWDGSYLFPAAPSLAPGEAYAVQFRNQAQVPGYLSEWNSRPISTYPAEGIVGVSAFDLADMTLVTPGAGLTVPLPVTFEWMIRAVTPADLYVLVLSDPADASRVFESPLLRDHDRFTLTALPAGFTYDTPYVWTVHVYGPDGARAVPASSYPVIFSND